MVGDTSRDARFVDDAHIANVRSLLCLPLIAQGKLTGVLYLENVETAHAFTEARLELMHMLSTQVATAVDNARLYASLEDYSRQLEARVAERTRELEAARHEAEVAKVAAGGGERGQE